MAANVPVRTNPRRVNTNCDWNIETLYGEVHQARDYAHGINRTFGSLQCTMSTPVAPFIPGTPFFTRYAYRPGRMNNRASAASFMQFTGNT